MSSSQNEVFAVLFPFPPRRGHVPSLLSKLHGLFQCSQDRKSTRLNSSHLVISYAVFCLKKKKNDNHHSIYLNLTPCWNHQYGSSYIYVMPLSLHLSFFNRRSASTRHLQHDCDVQPHITR